MVATVAIQAGTVVRDLTKPTTAEEIANAGDRQLQKGDLLVTMDGEGSIGKAAVFQDEYDAITDSHVAMIRFDNSDLARALACWINSSCGQAQIELAISGATGQTQLSKGDLENLQVPIELIERAINITADYQKTVRAYQPVTTHVRGLLCYFSVEVSEALIYSSTLGAEGKSALEKSASVEELSLLLSSLKPELF